APSRHLHPRPALSRNTREAGPHRDSARPVQRDARHRSEGSRDSGAQRLGHSRTQGLRYGEPGKRRHSGAYGRDSAWGPR
ncbi:MAG: hypothetical protein AVDCRST_MAG93-6105, partial [uncultured Chloroflexia bacterium]